MRRAQPNKTRALRASAILAEGVACHQRGDLDGAERSYRHALALQPNHADALHLSGLVARGRKDATRAAVLIRQAIAASPAVALYHVNLGVVLGDLGDAAGSIAAFARALELEPQHAVAAFNLGVALEERGELENAAEKYRLAAASLPEASFNLGNVMIALGRDADGIAAYREAVAARPGYARALSNLGGALQRLGELDAAAQTYRELLAVEPDDVEALHMVAALTGERRERADAAYVAKFFDEYAEEFEHTLVDGLGYKTPAEVATLVARHRPPRGSFVRALDLGCGTGLAGRAVRRECEVLIGVDISPNMLAKAREAGGYDELVVSDIGQFLERRGERFDLFIASDVLNYLGDLREPFRLVAARALPGALFVFSTEAGAEAVMLERTGRFSHGRSYVETMARETGFEVLGCQDEVLRKERGAAVRGHLFALRASAGA